MLATHLWICGGILVEACDDRTKTMRRKLKDAVTSAHSYPVVNIATGNQVDLFFWQMIYNWVYLLIIGFLMIFALSCSTGSTEYDSPWRGFWSCGACGCRMPPGSS